MRKIFVFLISMLVIASCTDPFEDNENNAVGSGGTNNPGATNKIYYTTSDGRKLFFNTSAFGAILVSNIYENGLGVLTFDDDITSIGDYAFRNCSSLTSITIPNSVTSIGEGAFSNCSRFTSITIPNSVTSIGNGVFMDCTSLKELCIEDGETVLSLGGLNADGSPFFYYCPLETIYLGRNLSCEAFNSLFSRKTTLTSVTIGNSVTSIGEEAFYGCSGLTSITIPNSVTSIGEDAFYGCSGLTSITVADGNTVYDSRDNSNAIIETESNTLIAGCNNTIIPNSVTSIGSSAFSDCTGLTSLTIPNSVTSIGEGAFLGCSGLTSITVADGNTVYDSRDNCNAIIETATNTLIAGCKNTIIPNSVTSIGEDAFYGCSGLTSITIPNSVTSIGNHAFNRCSGLTSVTIPNSVTSIGGSAFYGCLGLTSIEIPNSVTSIGSYAFMYCLGLTSIEIPNSVTSIGSSAFASTGWWNKQPDGLVYKDGWLLGGKGSSPSGYIVIKDGTKAIGNYAFYYCNFLRSITIPSSVTSIGADAFYYCFDLKEVHITDLNAWKDIYFDGRYANPLCYGAKLYLNGVEVTDY